MPRSKIDEIQRRWNHADLTGATIRLAGSRSPSTTVQALRAAPDDVAWLLGRVRALEAQLAGYSEAMSA